MLFRSPGVHKPKTLLGARLNEMVAENIDGVDVAVICLPANEAIGSGDEFVIRQIARYPIIVALTKTDLVSNEEIAAKLEISEQEFQKWLSDIAAGSVGPLDHVVADNTATSTHSDMHRATSPDAVIEADETRKIMRQEMKKLPEKERTVLVLYYEENLTLAEIGEVLGVTESRVSQIHTKAVLQLRSRLRAAEID